MWRRDGKELYFITDDQTLMAVSVKPGPESIEISTPTRLFGVKDTILAVNRPTYAPALDGQRFLFLIPSQPDRAEGIHLIHNWKP
jgi:hypothetical protein